MLDDYFNKKWEDFISKNTICGKLFTSKDHYCKLFMQGPCLNVVSDTVFDETFLILQFQFTPLRFVAQHEN